MNAKNTDRQANLIRFVDDDPTQRAAMKYMLEAEGYRVACYSGAREFLTHDTPSQPGLCILDLQMPEVNGLELQKTMTARSSGCPSSSSRPTETFRKRCSP